MKKFFMFMAAALVTFSLASCKNDKNEPETPATPAEEVSPYTITVSDITTKSAKVTVKSANEATYYWDILDAAEAAKMTDEQVGAYLKEYIEEAIEYYGDYGYDLTFEDFIVTGEDSYEYTKLESNAEYTVVAIAMDANGATSGKAARLTFKTLEEKEDPVPADMTFQIAVTDITYASANVAVTPSTNDATYYWEIFETADIQGMSDADLCAAIKENIEYMIELYGYYGYDLTFADFLAQGPDSYEYDELDANKAYTVIAVAMGTLGTTNGAVAKYNFQTAELTPESIEDITLTNARMVDAVSSYGWWQLIAANQDSTIYLTISPEETAAVAGTYSINDMDADYTYILIDKQNKYKFASLDVEVAVNGETFTLTGTGIATNAVEYHFTISGNVSVYQSAAAPAKVGPAKKNAKISKKVNLEKTQFVSEKAYIR